MPPLDLSKLRRDLSLRAGRQLELHDALSAALYPRVMDAYLQDLGKYEDLSLLSTPGYFYGMEVGQEIWVDIEPGKTLVILLSAVGEPDENGCRTVYFELNGHGRQVVVRDKSRAAKAEARRQAEKGNANHVGASMPGTVIGVHVKGGDAVDAGAPLLTLEAMKMETVVRAPRAGTVQEVLATLKSSVQGGDLLVVLG